MSMDSAQTAAPFTGQIAWGERRGGTRRRAGTSVPEVLWADEEVRRERLHAANNAAKECIRVVPDGSLLVTTYHGGPWRACRRNTWEAPRSSAGVGVQQAGTDCCTQTCDAREAATMSVQPVRILVIVLCQDMLGTLRGRGQAVRCGQGCAGWRAS